MIHMKDTLITHSLKERNGRSKVHVFSDVARIKMPLMCVDTR